MKELRLFSLLLALIFSATSCVDQLETEALDTTVRIESENKVKGPPPYIQSIVPQCGYLGATAKIYVGDAHYSGSVHIDVYTEEGFFVDRWSKNNPEYQQNLTFKVGTPPNGAKVCSLLDDNSTYRIAIHANSTPEPATGEHWSEGSNSTWPNPVREDTLNTIKDCPCTG